MLTIIFYFLKYSFGSERLTAREISHIPVISISPILLLDPMSEEYISCALEIGKILVVHNYTQTHFFNIYFVI